MADNNNSFSFGKEFDTNDFEPLDEGKYEVELTNLEQKTSKKSGNTYLNLTFTVRKDVQQKFQGRKLFYAVTKSKNNPNDPVFDYRVINKIVITQEGRPNYKTNFIDADEVFQYIQGLHMVVTVENEEDGNGGERSIIKRFSFEPSVWDTTSHHNATDGKAPEIKMGNMSAIDDTDDLPF